MQSKAAVCSSSWISDECILCPPRLAMREPIFFAFLLWSLSFPASFFTHFQTPSPSHLRKKTFIYLLFLAVLVLHLCTRTFSGCSEWGLLSLCCVGFLLRWLLLRWSTGSRVCGLSIHGSWAQMPLSVCGILVPGPRIEPVSPVLVSQFLPTGPPGK